MSIPRKIEMSKVVETFAPDVLDGDSLADHLIYIQGLIDEYGEDAFFMYDYDDGDIQVNKVRMETDDEYNARLERIFKANKAIEKIERATLLELKEKYEL